MKSSQIFEEYANRRYGGILYTGIQLTPSFVKNPTIKNILEK
jgi:hypothetical protein